MAITTIKQFHIATEMHRIFTAAEEAAHEGDVDKSRALIDVAYAMQTLPKDTFGFFSTKTKEEPE